MNYTLNDLNTFVFHGNDSETLILEKKTNRQVMLNRSGTEILNCIKKELTIGGILRFMKEKYPTISDEVLLRDINRVLELLALYKLINIETIVEETSAHIADVKEYSYFQELMESSDMRIFPKNLLPEYFDPIEMRFRAVNNKEQYALASLRQSQKPTFAIAFIPPVENSNVIMISAVMVNKDVDISNIVGDIDNLFLRVYSFNSHIKLRIAIESTFFKKWEGIFSLFNNVGFDLEATLIDETLNGDVVYLSKRLR